MPGKRQREAEEKARITALLADTNHAWEPRRAATSYQRVHKFREAARELGELPPVVDPERRERCRLDLAEFGYTYLLGPQGSGKMLERKPSQRMLGFVNILQDTILNGGNAHVRWPRGKGKSTWVKIAATWALAYGHRNFVVIIAATKPMADEASREIWGFMGADQTFGQDFPEIQVPLKDVDMTPQRMRLQTFRGERTHITDNPRFSYRRFAKLDGYENTGSIIAARGTDQAIRGLNIGSRRPDFVFIDDPQTDDDARSTGRGGQVEKIEDRIQGAIAGLGSTNSRVSAVMASTPIEPDDVSERFADNDRHPEWQTVTETFVVTFGPKEWIDKYLNMVRLDNLAKDSKLTKSNAFYLSHRAEIEAGSEMMDDSDFDKTKSELSAYQHALLKLHVMKQKRFDSEMQMRPTRSQGVYKIDPSLVSSRVNGYHFGIVPPECNQGVLAFCDVNAIAGLRWGIMAFGASRVTSMLAYGSYPKNGQRLFPEGTSEGAIPTYLASAMREVVKAIKATELQTPDGASVKIRGICFDGGWQTSTVATVCQELDSREFNVCWSMGYNSKMYSNYHHEKAKSVKGLKSGEMCHTWATANGVYLAFNSDYWREVSQTSFLALPLAPASCSFAGSDPMHHYGYASEICGETLTAKEDHPKYGTVWTWKKVGPNHYGDVNYGCLAYGAIRGNYDGVQKIAIIDELKEVAKLKPRVRKAPRYVYKH